MLQKSCDLRLMIPEAVQVLFLDITLAILCPAGLSHSIEYYTSLHILRLARTLDFDVAHNFEHQARPSTSQARTTPHSSAQHSIQ